MTGDRIAGLRSPGGSLITVYAPRPGPGGFAALLSELIRPVRDRAGEFSRPQEKAIRSDCQRIHELADEMEFDSAPAYAVFASEVDEIFLMEPLSAPTNASTTLGPRPYMRPLRATPRVLRSGVLVGDRATARTFVSMEGHIDEVGETIDSDLGSRNWGGFSGYDEHGVHSRAAELSTRVWKAAGERLLDHHLRSPLDYLVISSRPELRESISDSLHPYLANLPQASMSVAPQLVTQNLLRKELNETDEQVRRQRQEALAGRVCDTAWGGGTAVLGLSNVLKAANARAVETLVVAGPFSRSGVLCDQCGHLDRQGEECRVCGAKLFEVDDVVSAAMDSVIEAGGAAYQISVASTLDRDGVGALTRFPVSL